MAKIQANPAELKAISTSDDGQYAIYQFVCDGKPLNLAVAESDLMHMMMLTSQVSGKLQSIQKRDTAMKHILPCEWWQFDPHPDGQSMIFSFRMPGNLEVSFQFHLDCAPQMIETLQSLMGAPMSVPDGTTMQ